MKYSLGFKRPYDCYECQTFIDGGYNCKRLPTDRVCKLRFIKDKNHPKYGSKYNFLAPYCKRFRPIVKQLEMNFD